MGDNSGYCYEATLFCLAGFVICLALAIYYGLFKHPVYCGSASRKLRPGEQNLCSIPEGKDKVKISVPIEKMSDFTHYLFDSEPKISSVVRHRQYKYPSINILPRNHVTYAFALPKGSTITANLYSSSLFTKWYLTDEYMDGYNPAQIVWEYLWSSYGIGTSTLSMTVQQSRTYYLSCFIGGMHDDPAASTNWQIDIEYATYDLSNGKKICSGEVDCTKHNVTGKYIVSTLKEGFSYDSLVDNKFIVGDPERKMDYFISYLVSSIVFLAVGIILLLLGCCSD